MLDYVAGFVRRLTTLIRHRQRERDMDEEMRFHIEMEARDLARAGFAHDVSEREARIRFGGLERHKEAARDARGMRALQDLSQDLRYAARQSAQSASFTAATLLTLGLSIGAATFMYSFATMNPVPFSGADRLVYIRQTSKRDCPNCQLVASGNALALVGSSQALQSNAFVRGPSPATLRGESQSAVVRATDVSYAFFNTLRVGALLGRTFASADTLAGITPSIVISEPLWRAHFAADPSIVGRNIILDGQHVVVRGVIARDDVYPERTEIWTVHTFNALEKNEHRASASWLAIARLRDHATIDEARNEARTVSRRLARDFPADLRDWELDVRPLRLFGRGSEDDKMLFSVAAGFLLVIACVNLAGLLIARLTRRRRELAVRAAIGAEPWRLTRQLLSETVLISILAGVLAIGPAALGARMLRRAVPEFATPPGFTRFAVDWRACIVAVSLAAACGLLIALWPAIRFARPNLNDELREGVRTQGRRGATGGERVRRILVVIELALSVVLVTAAGLLVRSQAQLAKAPLGLASDHVLTVGVQLPPEIDGKRVETRGYFDRLAHELTRVRGVTSAGAVASLPLSGERSRSTSFEVAGRGPLPSSSATRLQVATPGYFAALRIPVVSGRAFASDDADSSRHVAVINETLARRFMPDEDPLGRVLVLPDSEQLTIVGVVADVRQRGALADPGPEILLPAARTPRRQMTLVLRTIHDPLPLSTAIVKAIASFDPNLAISRVQTMDEVVDDSLAPARVGEVAMEVFAAIAIVIAIMGLYSIVSFSVASRTREFGVRLALGATGRSLFTLVIRDGLRLAAAGLLIGLAGAVAVTRMMQWRLFQVGPSDAITLAAVVGGVFIVSLAAALVPARRALAVNPVTSLTAQ